jgi:uncharacterized integral membrane protein
MQFLKTLFWVVVAILLVLFASANWHAVTVHLWGGLEADVKLPVLVLGSFLLGLLPALVLHYTRLWKLRRKLEVQERQASAVQNVPYGPGHSPAPDVSLQEDRIATDAKAWPAS